MKRMLFSAALVAAVGLGTVAAFSQANEDEVATAMKKYPLAAAAGVDSHAIDKAPAGALNQGKFDDKSWKFGTAWDAPAGSKLWNPAKIKMLAGGKVTGGTLFAATDPEIYCAMANSGYDFIWVEHQHDARDWQNTQRMYAACPYAKAVPGVRVALFINLLGSLRAFDTIYVLTGGGPVRSTETVGFFMFRESFTQFKLGYGAAATLVLLVAVLIVSLPAIIQRTAGAK